MSTSHVDRNITSVTCMQEFAKNGNIIITVRNEVKTCPNFSNTSQS